LGKPKTIKVKQTARPSIFDKEYTHELCPKCRRKNLRFGFLTDNTPRIRRIRVKNTDIPIMFCPACGFYGRVKQSKQTKSVVQTTSVFPEADAL